LYLRDLLLKGGREKLGERGGGEEREGEGKMRGWKGEKGRARPPNILA